MPRHLHRDDMANDFSKLLRGFQRVARLNARLLQQMPPALAGRPVFMAPSDQYDHLMKVHACTMQMCAQICTTHVLPIGLQNTAYIFGFLFHAQS